MGDMVMESPQQNYKGQCFYLFHVGHHNPKLFEHKTL